MEAFSPKERSINFSIEEKGRLKILVEKYKCVLFNKKTDNINNLTKKKTWNAIHAEFNALSETPRTLKQLQAKFDNMKRSGRKGASKQRQEQFKTGGGPPPPPPDADTDWLRTVMQVSMDGLASTVDDDSQIYVQETEDIPEVLTISNKTGEYLQKVETEIANKNNVTDQKEISIQEMTKMPIITETDDYLQEIEETKENCNVANIQKEVLNTKSPACLLRTPMARTLKVPKKTRVSHTVPISNSMDTERLELYKSSRKYEKEIYHLRVNLLNEKKKQNDVIYKLKEKKLLLEISLLEKKLQ